VSEVVLARAGTPVARVVPLGGSLPRRGRGMLRGRLRLAEDWDSSGVNEAVAADFGTGHGLSSRHERTGP